MRQLLVLVSFLGIFVVTANTCLIEYDPFGFHGQAPFVHSLYKISEDKACENVIFYPPIKRLGYINEKTKVQKIPLNEKNRKDILNLLTTGNLAPDVAHTDISQSAYFDFEVAIEDEKIDRSFILYHGLPALIDAGNAGIPDVRNKKIRDILIKNYWMDDDLLALTQKNPQKLALLKTLLTKEGFYKNTCAKEANAYITDYPKYPDKLRPLANFDEKLPPLQKKYTQIIKKFGPRNASPAALEARCGIFKEAKDLLAEYYTTDRDPEYCDFVYDTLKRERNFYECLLQEFSSNLLFLSPFQHNAPNSLNLIMSCGVANEDLMNYSDVNYLRFLRGCSTQKQTFESDIKESRTDSAKNSAKLLCEGAPAGTQFTLGVDVNLATDHDSRIKVPGDKAYKEIADDSSEAKALLNIIHKEEANCDKVRVDLVKSDKALVEKTYKKENATDPSSPRRAVFYNFLQEYNCSPTKSLNEKQKADLKKYLYTTHLRLFLRKQSYANDLTLEDVGEYEKSDPNLAKSKSRVAIAATLEKKYQSLDLSTPKAQAQAVERLLYLMDEVNKGVGFFECYICDGKENASPFSCDTLKNSFSAYMYVGDKDEYALAKDPAQLNAELEKAAEAAETQAPPFCNGTLPACTFSPNGCPIDSNHQEQK